MQASLLRSALSGSLVAMASVLFTAPAGAMGRSTTPSIPTPTHASRLEAQPKNVATALYSQVEALRHEVAMLKSRVDRQDLAAAK